MEELKGKEWVFYIKKYKTPILLSALFNVGYSIFTLISIPLIIPFFQILFDTGQSQAPTGSNIIERVSEYFRILIEQQGKSQALIIVCALFLSAVVLRNIFKYFSLYHLAPVRNGVVANLRSTIHNHILKMPITYFTEEKKGDILTKAIADVQEVEWSILNFVEIIFRSPLLLFGSLALMIYISPSLTIWVFGLIILTVIIITFIGRPIKSMSKGAQDQLGQMTSTLEESISGVKVIRSYNAIERFIDRFDQLNLAYQTQLTRILRKKDLSAPLSETLGLTIVVLIMFIGAKLVFSNSLIPETFFAFLFAFYQVIEPSKALSNGYFNVQKGQAALDRINEILSTEPQLTQSLTGETINLNGNVTFEKVYFEYEGKEGYVIEDLSLEIKRNQKTALIGPSGGGKTTIINLLNRFITPSFGSILIGNKDIATISLNNYYTLIGLVTQESILFNDTIRFNITMGSEKFTDNEIFQALKAANAYDFVSELESGVDAMIGDNGMKLSGGQRQRLAIARAILHNSPIIILDEATSALDSESELKIQASIDELSKNKTIVFIAHRLSTIKSADHIILIDKGKIVAEGSHDDLTKYNNDYLQFIEGQSF